MIQENELITLLISIGAVIFISINYSKLKPLPALEILLLGLSILLIGWVLTIIEGFFLNEFFNLLEHICYMISSVLIAVWFWIAFKNKNGKQ